MFTESRNGQAMERNRELLEQYGLNPDEFLSETPPEVRIGWEFYVERMYRYFYSLAGDTRWRDWFCRAGGGKNGQRKKGTVGRSVQRKLNLLGRGRPINCFRYFHFVLSYTCFYYVPLFMCQTTEYICQWPDYARS